MTQKKYNRNLLRKCCICLLISFWVNLCYSQGENDNWYFGNKAGLNFSGSSATPLNNGNLVMWEGCATVSDSAGNLLFSCNGTTVWNRNQAVMPNGNGLIGHVSGVQTATIIPDPGNPKRYYIFSIEAMENSIANSTVNYSTGYDIAYSVVDMNLDNGLGDVVLTNPTKNTFVQSITPGGDAGVWWEYGCAVPGASGCDSWFCTFKNNFTLNAYKITASGVNPVPVTTSFPGESFAGCLVASPNGKKVAAGGVVFDFNQTTGVFSNLRKFGLSPAQLYYAAFSPNGSVLYVTAPNTCIWQLDLNNPNFNRYQINEPKMWGMSLAGNGKIYVVKSQGTGIPPPGVPSLSVINNPNVVGAGCDLQVNAINLAPGEAVLGLPQWVISCYRLDVMLLPTDVSCRDSCDGAITAIPIYGSPPYTYKWSNGQTGQIIKDLCPGTYTVTVSDKFGFVTATKSVELKVKYPDPIVTISENKTILPGDSIELSASGGALYQWKPSSGLSCDTCSSPIASPYRPTEYSVLVTDVHGCTNSASVTVFVEPHIYVPNTFTPNKDEINEVFKPFSNYPPLTYGLRIFNRWGSLLYEGNEINEGWDGKIDGIDAQIDVYSYQIDVEFLLPEGIVYKKKLIGKVTLVR